MLINPKSMYSSSSNRWRTGKPCSHHHHHHHQFCPHHHPHHHHHHHHHHHSLSPHCPLHCSQNSHTSTPLPPQYSQPLASSLSSLTISNLQVQSSDHNQVMQERNEGLIEEMDDDEEFVFVLTDEWKEFFAKSEAKRKFAKEAKKKGKKISKWT